MTYASADILNWLHRLDAYTNDVYGRARTLACIGRECVVCGAGAAPLDERGACPRCVVRLAPDDSVLVLFRPLRRLGLK